MRVVGWLAFAEAGIDPVQFCQPFLGMRILDVLLQPCPTIEHPPVQSGERTDAIVAKATFDESINSHGEISFLNPNASQEGVFGHGTLFNYS